MLGEYNKHKMYAICKACYLKVCQFVHVDIQANTHLQKVFVVFTQIECAINLLTDPFEFQPAIQRFFPLECGYQ